MLLSKLASIVAFAALAIATPVADADGLADMDAKKPITCAAQGGKCYNPGCKTPVCPKGTRSVFYDNHCSSKLWGNTVKCCVKK